MVMNITPEMARAELARRRSSTENASSGITPEMARAELARRRSLNSKSVSRLNDEKYENNEGGKSLENERSFLENSTRQLGRGTKNALGSATDVLDFIASPVRAGLNAIGLKTPTLGSQVEKGFENVYQPETNRERVQDEIMRAAGTLPIGGGVGSYLSAFKNAPSAVKGLSSFMQSANKLTPTNLAATSATSGTIQHAINQNPDDTLGAVGKGFATGVGVGISPAILSLLTPKGRSSAFSSLASNIGNKLGVNPSKIESFKQAGITPSLADVSSSAPLKVASTSGEKVPYIGKPLADLKTTQYNQIMEGLGQSNGFVPSRVDSGKLAIQGAKATHKRNRDIFDHMFSTVENDIGKLPNQNLSIEPITKSLEPIFKNINTLSHASDFEKSALGKLYKDDLYLSSIEYGSGKNIKTLLKEAKREFPKSTNEELEHILYKKYGGEVPYSQMKHVLKKINEKVTTHGLIGNESQGELKFLGKNVANVIETEMDPRIMGLGEEAYNNWKQHKPLYSEYAEGIVPNLNEMFKKNKKGAVDVFKDLVLNQANSGIKTKVVLEGLQPKQREELVTGIINEMGRNKDGTFSPIKWATQFNGLENEARTLLLSPLDKSNQKKVNAIADSIGEMKSTLAEANKSATAYHGILGALAYKGMNATGQLLAGNPLPAAKLAGGLLFGRVATGQLMANPKFINWIDKGMQAKSMEKFEKILNHPPKISGWKNILQKEAQIFQHDLDNSRDKSKKKSPVSE